MAYSTHPSFDTPADSVQLWRYMDLAKYLQTLHTSSLWFAAASRLGDPWEGSASPKNLELMNEQFTLADNDEALDELRLHDHMKEPLAHLESLRAMSAENRAAYKNASQQTGRHTRRMVFVSCWHQSDHESAAMWNQYADVGGIAIRTSVGSLKQSLRKTESGIYIGSVKYIDYDRTPVPQRNLFDAFLRKRQSFKHEAEVRAVQMDTETDGDQTRAAKPGLSVHIDVETLIDEVRVSPTMPAWFVEVVGSATKAVFPGIDIRMADMSSDPIL